MVDIREANGLSLAYLGDSVWEIVVREHFVQKGYKINQLHNLTKQYVNAKAQSLIYRGIVNDLDEEYLSVAKRAKNSNIRSFPKSCSIMEYREATAFEALIAVFYIKGEIEKIKMIFENYISEGGEE